MFTNLFAICLLVSDFQKSLDFYQNILGFKLKTQDGGFADFEFGTISLAIFDKQAATAMFPGKYMNSGGGLVLAVQVDNFDDVIHQLGSKGVEIFAGPKTTEWGQTVAYFRDPDGNIWEVSKL